MSATITTFPDFWTYPDRDFNERSGETIGTRAADEAETLGKLVWEPSADPVTLLKRIDRLEEATNAMALYRPDELVHLALLYPSPDMSMTVTLHGVAALLRKLIGQRSAPLGAAA